MNLSTRSFTAVAGTLALVAAAVCPLVAQEDVTVAGHVRDPAGMPVAGADVFLLETLDGALTDSAGSFTFESGALGTVTLVARKRDHIEVRRAAELPLGGPVTIVMQRTPVPLEPITVEAGTYRLGNLPDVTLSELDVVRTPGSAADPFRAIQTFPGVQSVGEGAGLFVRGGDVSETRVMLDGATVISPFRLDTDRTISFGRFDPFMLKGVQFSAGGFGAEFGDALSAVADLRTVDKPAANEVDLTAALGGLSGRLHLALSNPLGARATATYTHTDALLRLNGRREEFERVPVSTDLSGGFEWTYRDGASLKSFAMFQTDRVGVRITEPGFAGIYRSDARTHLAAISGRDAFGRAGVSWGIATSGSWKAEEFGAFGLERGDRLTQARATAEASIRSGIAVAAGVECEDRAADLAGSAPVESHDNAPDAPRTAFAGREAGMRAGGFGEVELQPSGVLRILVGARADHSTFTGSTTADPRVSATYRPIEGLTLTTAWGVFHQVPDPLLFQPVLGDPDLPSMAARHLIGGLAWEDGGRIIRVEAYRKRYRSLAARTRDGITRGQGSGHARGVDLFLKEDMGLFGLTGRMAYSFIDSERTDPDSGELASSPLEATHTLHIVVTRGFGGWLETGVAYRAATGTPRTPVREGVFDHGRGVWKPVFGPPMSERLPNYSRLDLSAYALRSFQPGNLTVFFVSVMNVLDAANVRDYRYSEDYSERISLDTPFPRTFYFGVTTTLPF